MSFKVACATADGQHFFEGHFGDAPFYIVYEVVENGFKESGRIDNHPSDTGHGEAEKANKIMGIMRQDINVFANFQYGPNIKRIRKKYVPVVIKNHNLDIRTAINRLQERFSEIQDITEHEKEEYPIVFIK